MNKFTHSFIFFAVISIIYAEEAVLKSKTSQTKSESATVPSPTSVYVPAAATGSSNGGSSDVAAILNNQAYDPTIFSTFVPQDAVQQYVSQYGTGYAGQALEGFLIPTFDRQEYTVSPSPTFISIIRSFLPGPKIILAIFAKIVALLASAIGVVFFGGAITSFVCAFTPLCTITFFGRPLSVLRQETKDIVEKIGEELTAERVKRAADLFRLALDKYQYMNQKS